FGGQLRDQTNGLRAGGIDTASGEQQIAHKSVGKVAFESRDAAKSGNEPQAQFGESKTRHFVGDDDVAGERQLESSTKADTMYGGDGHERSGVNGVQNPVNAREKFADAVEALFLGQRSRGVI